jgi:alanine racemase
MSRDPLEETLDSQAPQLGRRLSDLSEAEDFPRIQKPRRALPTDVVRPTRAEVSLTHLRHNLHVLRRVMPETPIWGVVKADGYGHGSKAVARTLERAGIDGLCVALVEEGVELREAGITLPILVMGGYTRGAFDELAHQNLTVVLQDPGQVEDFNEAIRRANHAPISAHLKVDTGMGRLGARRAEWPRFAASLKAAEGVIFGGLMTHFANADASEDGALVEPTRAFEAATELFRAAGLTPRLRHAGNSAAALRGQARYDLVRPGVALFGVDPLPESHSPLTDKSLGRLRPVMSVHTKIVGLRTIEVGEAVGYGSTWRAPRRSLIATVPMGYADGLSRALSNTGALLVRGKRAPIVGVVSMDLTMIDVTEIDGAALGDDATLLGTSKVVGGKPGEEAEITAKDLAEWSKTIPWEILTNISRRVPRFYREP